MIVSGRNGYGDGKAKGDGVICNSEEKEEGPSTLVATTMMGCYSYNGKMQLQK